MRIALRTMLFLIALIATASAVSHEEIERKGAEIMEEYRRDGGHWTPLNDMTQINHVRTTRAIFRVSIRMLIGRIRHTSMMDPLLAPARKAPAHVRCINNHATRKFRAAR